MRAPVALLAAAAAAAPLGAAARGSPSRSAMNAPGIGAVSIRSPARRPARAVILLSGEGGRDQASEAAADALADRGALVVLVDTPAYLRARQKPGCAYPAGDLETLAQHVEKTLGLDRYYRPVAVGHSLGAAVAWAALAQAPPGTFAGAAASGMCPEQPLALRLCAGAGPIPRKLAGGEMPALVPAPGPFEIVSGAGDATCPPAAAQAFADAVKARFTAVPHAGHTMSPALVDAVASAVERIPEPKPAAQPPPPPVADLPLVELRASKPGSRLAVLITGDGAGSA